VFSWLKSWRFGLGYLAFVIAGSLLLLTWLRQREREESSRLFQALAQADSDFVRRMSLPRSEKLASDLGQLLGMRIEFHKAGQGLASNEHTLVIRLDEKNDMIFTRQPVATQLSLRDPATRNALLAFWSLAAFVGAMLARERSKRAQTERLAMLGRVATSLAHDIKNPLASIQLHSQLIKPANEEDIKAVNLIQNESKVISGLVNQWLYLANPVPPIVTRLDLFEIIQSVVTYLEPQAQHSGVKIESSLPPQLHIQGDRQRLAQAIRNLVINAIQAMAHGGTLRINAKKQDRHFTIFFCDSGPGFSEASLARGTELFYTEREAGMGVGLNIAATIVNEHGGQLSLHNDTHQGAVVRISLPYATESS
jgi:signal transduction histidine kinase